MGESKLVKKFSYFIQAISDNYFAMFYVDLKSKKIGAIKYTEPLVPLLNNFMLTNENYDDCIEFFCNHFVVDEEKDAVREKISLNALKERLIDYGSFVYNYTHKIQDDKQSAEVIIADTSDDHDGSRCMIAIRFINENKKTTREALKKQDDMLKTLVKDYNAIYHVDLNNNTFVILKAGNLIFDDIFEHINQKLPYSKTFHDFIASKISEKYHEELFKLCDTSYLKKRLKDNVPLSFRYKIKEETRGMNYFELQFSKVNSTNKDFCAILTVKNIDYTVTKEIKYHQEIENANKELKNSLEQQKLYQAELKRSFEAAQLANKAKTDFLSRMSHDIRTPMNAIIGITAIASANTDDPKKIKDCLSKISASSQYLLGIINDILDMSRIESGKVQIHEEEFNLMKILNNSVEMITPKVDEHQHTLNFDASKIKHANLIGDPNRIQQVFANILSNAVKYTPTGGLIKFSAQEKKSFNKKIGTYVFTFQDNGIGMSKEFIKKIFNPFEREEDLRTSKIKGSGLGMSIVHNIVQMMGGTIDVESEYTKGSKFTVTLPLKYANEITVESENFLQNAGSTQNSENPLDDIKRQDFTGTRLLLVEDNEINLEIMKEIVELTNAKIETAEDGKIALEKFNESPENYFDLILMDIQMPVMNGLEATKAIRSLNRKDAKTVPIIALSANTFEEDIHEAKLAGMNEHLAKPLEIKKLSEVLNRWIKY